MEKTSRRSFGKQLTGAVAAITTTSFAPGDGERTPNVDAKQNKRSHDTPPPLDFTNGSLVIEKRDAFHETSLSTDRTRMEYRTRPYPGNRTIYPAHVKIVDGSGEMLFRKDDETGALAVSIELRNVNGSAGSASIINAQALVDRSKFIVDVDSDKTLDLGDQVHNDKPTSKKRTHRYRHSSAALSMWEVTVKQGARILYSISPRELPLEGADLKVMIWLEPV